MGRVTITGTQARCMHAMCKNAQKRVSAGQKKACLRPKFVQPSPQCAGGLGVAKNSERRLDHLRRRRLPGWPVLTADDRLPSLGRDCGGRKISLPARLRGVTHHMLHMSTAHVLRPQKFRTPPYVPPKVSCWCKAHRARLGAFRAGAGEQCRARGPWECVWERLAQARAKRSIGFRARLQSPSRFDQGSSLTSWLSWPKRA